MYIYLSRVHDILTVCRPIMVYSLRIDLFHYRFIHLHTRVVSILLKFSLFHNIIQDVYQCYFCNSDNVYGSLEIADKCIVICLLYIRNQIRGTYLIWGVVGFYICNQCLSPFMLWVQISIRACGFLPVLKFPPPIKLTDWHDITEILLKVALNTIKQTNKKHI